MNHRKRKREDDTDDTDIEDMNMDAVTDSEEEYTETEKKLLQKARKGRTTENYDSDDEVYGLQDSEEEEEENEQDSLESDVEGLQEDIDMPDDRAWGKKAKNFYSSDYKYTDYASATQRDLTNAEIEEQEAKKLYTRSTNEIFDIDDRFMLTADTKLDHQEDSEQTVEFSKLSKKHKQALEQKESKAFTVLVTDFKERMIEMKNVLLPFLKLVEDGTCPDCDAVTFIRTKYHLTLNYCTNICFYLMLKAKGSPVQSHPVIKHLEHYRQLLARLQSANEDLLEQVAEIVKAVKEGKPLYSISGDSLKPIKKRISEFANVNKKLSHRKEAMRRQEKEQLLFDDTDISDNMSEEGYTDKEKLATEERYDDKDEKNEKDNAILDTMNEVEGKRAITYQIAKNRGLTPYRKKELRNPRVKHRNKYRKAKIRRRGAVREVRKELTRYTGEISGIKAGVTKSIKLK